MAAWLEPMSYAVAAGIAGLIGLGFARLNAYIAEKTKNEKIKKALLALSEIVKNSVLAIQQTFVEQLKKDGRFDKENQKVALQKAVDLALSNMSEELKSQAKLLYPDLENWVRTQVEAIVNTSLPHGLYEPKISSSDPDNRKALLEN